MYEAGISLFPSISGPERSLHGCHRSGHSIRRLLLVGEVRRTNFLTRQALLYTGAWLPLFFCADFETAIYIFVGASHDGANTEHRS